jgi:uncharacterized membrane protein
MARVKCKERRDAESEGATEGAIVGAVFGFVLFGPIGAAVGATLVGALNAKSRGEAVRKRKNCKCRH